MTDLFPTSHQDTNSSFSSYLFPCLSTVPRFAVPFASRDAGKQRGAGTPQGSRGGCLWEGAFSLQNSAVGRALHLLWAAKRVIVTL